MKERELTPIRERWRSLDGAGDEANAGRLLERAARPRRLGPAALDALHERLFLRTASPRAPVRLWRVAVAALLLLLSGGALMAAVTHVLRRPAAPALHASSSPGVARARRLAAAATDPAPAAPPEVLPEPPPPTMSPRPATRRPLVIAEAAPEPDPSLAPPPALAPSPPSALGEEAALLAAALRRLRDEGDAAGTLTLLDEHDRRFGATGPLAREATLTRVEAWLRNGEHQQALDALDRLPLSTTGRGRVLLAARADLRAEAGRCAEALRDFDELLARETADGVEERALFGRASCTSRSGDPTKARADLERYLSRFPEGRFSAAARAALDH